MAHAERSAIEMDKYNTIQYQENIQYQGVKHVTNVYITVFITCNLHQLG